MTTDLPVPIFYGFYEGSSKKEALQEAVRSIGYNDKSEIERVIQGFPEPVVYTFGSQKIEAYELISPIGKRLEIGIEKSRWYNPLTDGFALFMLINRKKFNKICLQVKKQHK